jgi:Na+:H+ antiporter, NhaA family
MHVGDHHLTHWVNDGLMVIFFLLIGLELKRELYIGELSEIKKASLPVIGALGGMLLPGIIFFIFNFGLPTQKGFGIPMATDIAFAIGILSILGNRVPAALKVFLVALAVIDDLGAIILIAIFYCSDLCFTNLFISLGIWVFLFGLNLLRVRYLIIYLIGGVFMWYFMLHSGVHATIAGVLLAFAIPFGKGSKTAASHILEHILHKPVMFFILPVFAMANTCIPIASNWQSSLAEPHSLGIILGLLFGKPIGIFILSYIGVGLGLSALPTGIQWKGLFGVGILAGIGFTMSFFIAMLAFSDPALIDSSKIAILVGSSSAAIAGLVFLKYSQKKEKVLG